MADWAQIKSEYIAGNCTYRSLAKKHNVSLSRLSKMGTQEAWPVLRAQAWQKSEHMMVESAAEGKKRIVSAMVSATEALVEKASAGISAAEPADYRSLKGYSGILKDVHDILDIRSPGDVAEQEARIARLRADVDKAAEGTSISISLGGAEAWAE